MFFFLKSTYVLWKLKKFCKNLKLISLSSAQFCNLYVMSCKCTTIREENISRKQLGIKSWRSSIGQEVGPSQTGWQWEVVALGLQQASHKDGPAAGCCQKRVQNCCQIGLIDWGTSQINLCPSVSSVLNLAIHHSLLSSSNEKDLNPSKSRLRGTGEVALYFFTT